MTPSSEQPEPAPLSCDRVLRMSSLFHDDRLDQAWTVAVESHLVDCVACRTEIDALAELGSAVRHAPSRGAVPDLADRVRAALRAGQHMGLDGGGDCLPVKSGSFRRFTHSRIASAAAVVLSLLTFGVAGYALGRNQPRNGLGDGPDGVPVASRMPEADATQARPVTLASLTETGFEPGPFVRGAQGLVDDVLVMEPADEPVSREQQRLVLAGQLHQFGLSQQAHDVLAVVRPDAATDKLPSLDQEMEQIGRLARCVLVVEESLDGPQLDLEPLRVRLSQVAFDGVFEPLRDVAVADSRPREKRVEVFGVRGPQSGDAGEERFLRRFMQLKAYFVDGSVPTTRAWTSSPPRVLTPGYRGVPNTGMQVMMEFVSEPDFVFWVQRSGLGPNLQALGSRLERHDQQVFLMQVEAQGALVTDEDNGSFFSVPTSRPTTTITIREQREER